MKKWEEIPSIDMYTDGGADPNPGKGGYGVILSYKGRSKEFSQGYTLTTNNRMELMAVIFGLEQIKTKANVHVYSDSKYVVDGITKGWAAKWRSNDWLRTKKDKAINSDLWSRLLDVVEKHHVKFTWVKGHAGHEQNERCDALATEALNSATLIEDKGYKPPEAPNDSVIETNAKSSYKKQGRKVKKEGDKCRRCKTPVIKKPRKPNKKIKANQTYYYEYIFLCPACNNIYMTEDAKRMVNKDNGLF